jgi:NRAMP (natural resistance-associated macrophage protein)-like metal ion transporter
VKPGQAEAPQGLEPVAEVEIPALPNVARPVRPALALTLRGRTVRLRGWRPPPTGLWRWLAILGPGLIAASAGNDAGGIATYSQAGAQFGYDLLWLMLVITVSLAVIQEMCARLGVVTGRGLMDLIRERFGLRWALLALGVIVVANASLVITEFVGIGAAAELLGVSPYLAVPLTALLLWYLVISGSYAQVEKVFIAMTLVFFSYPAAAALAHPDWGSVLRGTLVPSMRLEKASLQMVVALIGTTVTPFMQFFQQSSTVEKDVPRRHYGPVRADTYFGAAFSNLISAFMIIATAATLHLAGKTEIASAADAAQALAPIAGPMAGTFFAVGLLGAALLAAGVLPLATAYSASEMFGLAKGVSLDFRRAPLFFGLFTTFIALGAVAALLPGLPVIALLIAIQVLNGCLLPAILLFVLLLSNDAELVGEFKNNRLHNLLGWGTFALVTAAVIALLGLQLLEALGVSVAR